MFGSSPKIKTPTPVFAAPAALAPSASATATSANRGSISSRFGTTAGASLVNSMSRDGSEGQRRKNRALMGS